MRYDKYAIHMEVFIEETACTVAADYPICCSFDHDLWNTNSESFLRPVCGNSIHKSPIFTKTRTSGKASWLGLMGCHQGLVSWRNKAERKEINRRVRSAAKMLQIDHLLDHRPSELSGGQKQRVAIGSAIVRDADAYFPDERLPGSKTGCRSRN